MNVQKCDLRKQGASVSQHHDFAFCANRLPPGVHNEGIVHRDAGNGIDPCCFELVCFLDKTW